MGKSIVENKCSDWYLLYIKTSLSFPNQYGVDELYNVYSFLSASFTQPTSDCQLSRINTWWGRDSHAYILVITLRATQVHLY